MKLQIKFLSIVIAALTPFAPAQATPSENQPKLIENFVSTCLDLKRKELTADVCQCLGKNYVTVAMAENDLKKTIKAFLWIKSLYRGTLSQADYRKDEFALNELIDDIHKGCVRTSTYDHSKLLKE